jgi:streptomycin 3"-adenylyltransferase
VNEQVERLVDELRGALGANLVGIYLHGSLALGCFNPERSDIDVLVVTCDLLSDEQRASLTRCLSSLQQRPHRIELHSLAVEQLHPWRHPAPFDFYFYADASEGTTDRDLAAHISVVRRMGIALHGPQPTDVFPPMPPSDYADALLSDLRWTLREHPDDLYGALSPVRVWAGIADPETIQTKESAARWALERTPAQHRPALEHALAMYRGEREDDLDPEAVRALALFVAARVEELRDAEAAASP